MFLFKTIMTKKTSHNHYTWFLPFLLLLSSLILIVVAWYSRSNQCNVFGHCEQIFLLLRTCDQQVCASFVLLIFVLDPISTSRIANQVVMIVQDFHEMTEWSLCFLRSFPCISNSCLPVPSQKLIQMLSFGTTLLTTWDTCNMMIADQINQYLFFFHGDPVLLVASWCVHFYHWYFQYPPQLLNATVV